LVRWYQALCLLSVYLSIYILKYSVPVALDVAYGSQALQKMDVHFPGKLSVESPVVFLIHGGGFVMGRKEDFEYQARLFCDQGFVVVNLSHQLVDAGWFSHSGAAVRSGIKISDQLADIDAAVRVYKKKAADWGSGTGRLYVAGHSAGAILGMLYMLQNGEHEGIRAAGNWAGITDLSLPMDAMGSFLQPWQRNQMQAIYDKMLNYTALSGGTGDAKSISPYWVASRHGGRPVISIYPEDNAVLRFPGESALGLMQTKRFHALLRSQGVAEAFSMYAGCDHNFRGVGNAWERCVKETAEFFAKH
jgi:acetyl esterase/lipase